MTAPTSLPGSPPRGAPPQKPPPGRLASWAFTSVLVGWVVAYNVLRVSGRSPSGAALTSLLIGIGIGAVLFGITWLVWRSLIGSGRYRPHHLEEIPPPSRLDGRQRTAIDFLWPTVGVLAVLAVGVGGVMAFDWYNTDGSRSWLKIILAGWNLLVGVWLALEARELKALHGEAVESIAMAALLTAVLAGVALSNEVFPAGQAALIVLAGIAGAAANYAVWRLLGSRGIPLGIAASVIVAALALILPTTL